ncbi:anti-sigma factor antagonist [Bacteroidetes/Chlorobi group bacterium MS-B_bin-24]|jgi:anti-sigma B factor antagonist|nr:MAG: anti-sigma factor antagonist [Bacteroidetes/Chlorobi group bacterium MS-B_bin-24]
MTEKLSINSQKIGKQLEIIFVKGILDAHSAPDLEKFVAETIAQGNIYLLFNLKELDYISSAGLGVFMAFVEDLRNRGGDIKFAELTEKIYSIFELLGFHLIFDIVPTNDQAIELFNQKKLRTNE